MQKSLVAFIDLLGFKAAIESTDQQTFHAIYSVLTHFASTNANYSHQVEEIKPGQKRTYSSPAVSSFSDHILISQPISTKKDDGLHDLTIGVWHMQHSIARIAELALMNGFLIRGGLTIGEMHHDRNIVFGKPLVEAADIEATLAKYPRVVTSDKLIAEITEKSKKSIDSVIGIKILRKDFDGVYYLDWINDSKFLLCGNQRFSETEFAKRLAPLKKIIEDNLVALKGRQNVYKNWYWMANYFNNSLLDINMAIGAPPANQELLPKIDLQSF